MVPPKKPQVAGGHRIYVIGDIHGHIDLLIRMRDLITTDLDQSPSAEEAITIFLGDYVDRGPDSQAVLDEIIHGPFPTRLVPLLGNHEAMLLAFLSRPETGAGWAQYGGLETLHSYGIDVRPLRSGVGFADVARKFREKLPSSHSEFLQLCRLYFLAGDYFFCHAGVRPGVPLDEQRENDLLWMREPFLSSEKDFGKVVVHGHTPVSSPDIRPNRINIDTGAYITGRLTCLVLEGEEQRFLFTGIGAAAPVVPVDASLGR